MNFYINFPGTEKRLHVSHFDRTKPSQKSLSHTKWFNVVRLFHKILPELFRYWLKVTSDMSRPQSNGRTIPLVEVYPIDILLFQFKCMTREILVFVIF
jgi:hypothetical protein